MKLLSVPCLAACLLAIACGSIPETRYFTIGRIVPEPGKFTAKINLSVGVPQFEAEGIYAQDNLLYRRGNYEIAADYYRHWGMPPQKMLSETTMDYLRSSGLFAEVERLPSLKRVDLVLEGRILRFEELSGAQGNEVRVDLEFSLRKSGDYAQIWWQQVTASSPIGPVYTPEAVVAAAGKSIRSCLDQAAESMAQAFPKMGAPEK